MSIRNPRGATVPPFYAGEIAREVGKDGDIVVLMSGRGDKDIFTVAKHVGVEL